jgi:hypothetical protein
MKKTILKILLITGILLIALVWYMREAYVIFTPKLTTNGITSIVNVNNDFNNRLIIVLSYYDIPFKKKNGSIFIKRKLDDDIELVASYTRKAMDDNWIKSHK